MLVGRLPMLVRARACGLLPETPSSFRRASAVASSSIAFQPSCVPRRSECATALGVCEADDALLGGAGCFKKLWMAVDDGDGGRCE
jgi:hypothetical protein